MAQEIEAKRVEKQEWSAKQWKKLVEERHAQKMATLKMIQNQSRTWITRENLDERVEQAVDAIMIPSEQ